MIPLWVITLLSTIGVGEFSYDNKYRIFIKGKFLEGEWVVDVHVYATPYFSWGCNKLRTGIKGSFKSVVRHYLILVLNQLSEYGAEGRKELLFVMRRYLSN